MVISKSKLFKEPEVKGDIFGGVKYFDTKRKYMVFSLCPSGRSEVDGKAMASRLKDLIQEQVDVMKSDFESAKHSLFRVPSSHREDMAKFINALYAAAQKMGGSFDKSDLTRYLSESDSPYNYAPNAPTSLWSDSPPKGRNGAELCKRHVYNRLGVMLCGVAVF